MSPGTFVHNCIVRMALHSILCMWHIVAVLGNLFCMSLGGQGRMGWVDRAPKIDLVLSLGHF